MDESWDDRFASFLERVMATAAAGGDPKPLQEEYAKLLQEAPEESLQRLKLERKKTDGKPTRKRPAAATR
jgi:hypothetical protein